MEKLSEIKPERTEYKVLCINEKILKPEIFENFEFLLDSVMSILGRRKKLDSDARVQFDIIIFLLNTKIVKPEYEIQKNLIAMLQKKIQKPIFVYYCNNDIAGNNFIEIAPNLILLVIFLQC